ncbi:MAG: SBBP repeat-containing protein [Candidatus Hydrogenedentes bacterium]|nr:SBBP repeat-containing protein [Candidatus Hydrogenedentota bacterium]
MHGRFVILLAISGLFLQVAFSPCALAGDWATKAVPAAGDLLWADGIGGTGSTTVNATAVDGSGNVYVTGRFSGTADFDPGAGVYNLTAGGTEDFVCKFDTDGDLVWAAHILGTTNVLPYNSLEVDQAGAVYFTGLFTGQPDFDPGPGVFNLTASGVDAYICKLDTDGNFQWAAKLHTYSYLLALDAQGAVYATGAFAGTVDFDPGPGVFNLTSISGVQDTYICKLDTNGQFVYARQFGGTGVPWIESIDADPSGNVYLHLYFDAGAIDFDPGPGDFTLTSAGIRQTVITKLDTAGDFAWAKRFGGAGSTSSAYSTTDAEGNVLVVGSFSGGVDFDPGPGDYPIYSNGGNVFIVKLDYNGGFLWAKAFGGSYGSVSPSDVALDSNSNIYVAGIFGHQSDFDPGPAEYILYNAGLDSYVSKLDPEGNFVYVKQFRSEGAQFITRVVLDTDRNIYLGGFLDGITDFDPGPATFNLGVSSSRSGYIVKLAGPPPMPSDISGDDAVDAVDIQLVINKALGLAITGNADVNGDTFVDASDIQTVINTALGLG